MGDMPFELVLGDAVFAGNAMITVNGSTPYNALYGRVPAILPSIDQINNPRGSPSADPRTQHDTNRLREVSVQNMIEGSAAARLGRTMNTRTTMPAQRLDLQVGEEVDFYREPSQKDASGWSGPAEVTDVSRAERGVITVRWLNRPTEVQLSRVRRHLHFLVYFMSHYLSYLSDTTNPHHNAWAHIRRTAENITHGDLIHVGHVWDPQYRWTKLTHNAAL